jgi:NAD(P)-dependent dehydrogenase (short-subunit alcohol dehydrogenase family)
MSQDRGAGTSATGRTVVITGGSSGIGRAAAHAFVARGDRVALLARGEISLRATAEELRHPEQVLTFACDVTNREAVDRVVDEVVLRWGGVDVWVNSAVALVFGRFDDIDADDFDRVVDVVFTGTVNGTRSALRVMRAAGRGRIVQVGSAVALHGVPLQSPYVSAKHAVHGFSDAVRAELAHDASPITISEVNLPAVNTPLYRSAKSLLPRRVRPFPPVYQPETAAAGVLRAADSGARRVDVSATTTGVAVADVLLPGVFERLLGRVGLDLQQTEVPAEASDGGILHEPSDADYGAHGEYDDKARQRSYKELLRRAVPVRATRIADQSRRITAAALAEVAVRTGIAPRR